MKKEFNVKLANSCSILPKQAEEILSRPIKKTILNQVAFAVKLINQFKYINK